MLRGGVINDNDFGNMVKIYNVLKKGTDTAVEWAYANSEVLCVPNWTDEFGGVGHAAEIFKQWGSNRHFFSICVGFILNAFLLFKSIAIEASFVSPVKLVLDPRRVVDVLLAVVSCKVASKRRHYVEVQYAELKRAMSGSMAVVRSVNFDRLIDVSVSLNKEWRYSLPLAFGMGAFNFNLREVGEDHSRHVAVGKRVFPSSAADCKGLFQSDDGVCNTCKAKFCRHCHVQFGADPKAHDCKDEDIATINILLTATKPCPRCASPVMKSMGCDQMFCTACHTPFLWNTLTIVHRTDALHNPYWFQLAQRDRDAVLARLPEAPTGEATHDSPQTPNQRVNLKNPELFACMRLGDDAFHMAFHRALSDVGPILYTGQPVARPNHNENREVQQELRYWETYQLAVNKGRENLVNTELCNRMHRIHYLLGYDERCVGGGTSAMQARQNHFKRQRREFVDKVCRGQARVKHKSHSEAFPLNFQFLFSP